MRRLPVTAILGLALILAHLPAESSEVVRLARLVITGKRLSPERLEPVAIQTPAKDATPTHTAQASPPAAGQEGPARQPAAPSRGVLSFF